MTTQLFVVTEGLDTYVNTLATCESQLSGVAKGIATGLVEGAVEAGFHLPHAQAMLDDVGAAGVAWVQLSTLLPSMVASLGDHSLAMRMAEGAFTGALGAVVSLPGEMVSDSLVALSVQTMEPIPGSKVLSIKTEEVSGTVTGDVVDGSGDAEFIVTKLQAPDGQIYYEVQYGEAVGLGEGIGGPTDGGSYSVGLEDAKTWYVATPDDVNHLKDRILVGDVAEAGGSVFGGIGVLAGMSVANAATPKPYSETEGVYGSVQGSVQADGASASASGSVHFDAEEINGQVIPVATVDVSGQAGLNLDAYGIKADTSGTMDYSAALTMGKDPTLTIQGSIMTTDSVMIDGRSIGTAGEAHEVVVSATIPLDSQTAKDLEAAMSDPATASADIQNLLHGVTGQVQVFQGTSSSSQPLDVGPVDVKVTNTNLQLVHQESLTL